MTSNVSKGELNRAMTKLNRRTGRPVSPAKGDEPCVGHLLLDNSNSGMRMWQIMNDQGFEVAVLDGPHRTSREMFDLISAMIVALDLAGSPPKEHVLDDSTAQVERVARALHGRANKSQKSAAWDTAPPASRDAWRKLAVVAIAAH
jgi:hypothetical protein